ncbi:hypothetical protein [Moorena bouillonii]|uniref:hypothetical protein n=1 Tax=Moorena bouillonii TaxID=207920 RepID=UPI00117D6650|nr:hypothetical protein [Moorena bouillonii]
MAIRCRVGLNLNYTICPIPDSRFPIPDSRFPIPDSRFPIPDSRFPIPDSLLKPILANRLLRILTYQCPDSDW